MSTIDLIIVCLTVLLALGLIVGAFAVLRVDARMSADDRDRERRRELEGNKRVAERQPDRPFDIGDRVVLHSDAQSVRGVVVGFAADAVQLRDATLTAGGVETSMGGVTCVALGSVDVWQVLYDPPEVARPAAGPRSLSERTRASIDAQRRQGEAQQ